MTYSNRRMKLLSTSFEILAETDADANEKHKLFGNEFQGWCRGSPLRHHLRRRSFSSSRIDQVGILDYDNLSQKTIYGQDITITDEFDPECSSNTGSLASERGIDVGRVGGWASDFERLLTDPVGLRTFTEFLKKEFSHENIRFWTACERYRNLSPDFPDNTRFKLAEEIIRRHLSTGAPEQVNVDSHARQAAIDGLQDVSPTLFSAAQKQIYNLMKFDSFSRFLKSELYNESLKAEISGKPMRFDTDDKEFNHYFNEASYPDRLLGRSKSKFDKHDSDWTLHNPGSEPSRRRSILPSWHNLRGNSHGKGRSKSKDRLETSSKKSRDELRKLSSDSDSQSLAACTGIIDGDESNCQLARIILPDKATTVVHTKKDETIRAMVGRLLDKRGLKYTSFDVFKIDQPEKPLDLSADCSTLAYTEVRVEPRVLFRLELPSKKSIGVKAKPSKLVKDVLGPILQQYGCNLDSVIVRREGETPLQGPIEMTQPVAVVDNSRISVFYKASNEKFDRQGEINSISSEEIQTKPEAPNENSAVKILQKSISSLKSNKYYQDSTLQLPPGRKLPQPPGKSSTLKLISGLPNNINDDLAEGIKIAQRGRIDDQRGTEIRFEMPEFLKRPPEKSLLTTQLQSRQSEPNLTHHQNYSFANGSGSGILRRTPVSLTTNELTPTMTKLDRSFSGSRDNFLDPPDSRVTLGQHSSPPHFYSEGNSFYDPIFETLSTFKHTSSRQWTSNITNFSPNGVKAKRSDPPPLPPKPKLLVLKPDFVPGVKNFKSSNFDLGKTQVDERGFSVSFV